MMNSFSKKVFLVLMAILVAVVLAGGGVVATLSSARAARPATVDVSAPAMDQTSPSLVTLASGTTNYTQSYTTSTRYIGGHTLWDYFWGIGISTTEYLTYIVQTAPDLSGPWGNTVVVFAGTATTVATPIRGNAIGSYVRLLVQVSNSEPYRFTYTPTFKIVLK